MNRFWVLFDQLVSTSRLMIDRPKGSRHPRYPEIIYPVDYGYLEGTSSGDGEGIDAWLGTSEAHSLTAALLTIDLAKRDAEVKLLLGCSAEETQAILDFHNTDKMQAILIQRNETCE